VNIFSKASRASSRRPERARASTYQKVQMEKVPSEPSSPSGEAAGSFHGPLVDYAEDAQIYRSIEREMEEELFSRADVDSVLGDQRRAGPCIAAGCPNRWAGSATLHDNSWRMECTGFGFNLLTGNYEFASLIVVYDESWWDAYGGHIEANWESTGLRRYSTLDRDAIIALILDSAWSNEGLFALLQGLRRLAEIGGDRTDLPDIDWGN
jgi:hypothetical protein